MGWLGDGAATGMVIGILQFELLVHDAESLKDKRRVVRSVKDRLHREHLVAVAEVGDLDNAGRALMAAAAVGIEGKRVAETLDHITEKLRQLVDAELGDCRRTLLQGSQLPEDLEDRQMSAEEEEALAMEMLRRAGEGGDALGERDR